MASINEWMQDLMSQKFLDSDITRLIIVNALCNTGLFKKVYSKKEVTEYVYRVYVDNKAAASNNPYSTIRNITSYGVAELYEFVDKALFTWSEYAPNKVLMYDEHRIYFDLDTDLLITSVPYSMQVVQMLVSKYFDFSFNPPERLSIEECKNDMNLDLFGSGVFKRRLLEDMQYCPLCEEYRFNRLRAVHILPARFCRTEDELVDKDNGILLCEEHAQAYLDQKFLFKGNGFVSNLSNIGLDKRMHLSIQIKNPRRREYLERYEKLILGENTE